MMRIFLFIVIISLTVLSTDIAKTQQILNYDITIPLTNDQSVIYYSYKGTNNPLNTFIDIDIVDIDLRNNHLNIGPIQSTKIDTVENIAKNSNAIAAINGGYFDYTNGKTVSYVIVDGKVIGNPSANNNLISNTKIKPYINQILNRPELKKYICSGKIYYHISNHDSKNDVCNKKCTLTDSLQGGPKLLPDMNLEKEAFLVYKNGTKIRESANVTNPDTRVAVGITEKNHMIWLLAKAGYNNHKYYGLNIYQLSKFLKALGVKTALAYDGGKSSTMYIKLPNGSDKTVIGHIDSKKQRIPAKVKSILLLKKGI